MDTHAVHVCVYVCKTRTNIRMCIHFSPFHSSCPYKHTKYHVYTSTPNTHAVYICVCMYVRLVQIKPIFVYRHVQIYMMSVYM